LCGNNHARSSAEGFVNNLKNSVSGRIALAGEDAGNISPPQNGYLLVCHDDFAVIEFRAGFGKLDKGISGNLA